MTNIKLRSDPNLAASITKAASQQTYYTIRLLADRDLLDDAYRAYAYFRWVDDCLDLPSGSSAERLAFIGRQKSLLESCYRQAFPLDVNANEQMLVDLVHHDVESQPLIRTCGTYWLPILMMFKLKRLLSDFNSIRTGDPYPLPEP